MTPTVTLYGKPGCCLCDEAREAIAAVRARAPASSSTEVDVSLDPVLHARYGERIPVVAVDGEEAVRATTWTLAELARRLDTVAA